MLTRFLGICGWWRGVHGLPFSLHLGGSVNFQMSSANVLEVAKFHSALLRFFFFELKGLIRSKGRAISSGG
jgi:hypothetical protein